MATSRTKYISGTAVHAVALAIVSSGAADDFSAATEILLQARWDAEGLEEVYDRAKTLRLIAASMGRPKRSADGDLVYHVLNRSNAKMPIFKKDGDEMWSDKVVR